MKYEAKPGCQRGVEIHRDGSILSFNVLLNSSGDFTGGGTYIEEDDKVYEIGQGDIFCHSGMLRHGGFPITSGMRVILVGFLDVMGKGAQKIKPSGAWA